MRPRHALFGGAAALTLLFTSCTSAYSGATNNNGGTCQYRWTFTNISNQSNPPAPVDAIIDAVTLTPDNGAGPTGGPHQFVGATVAPGQSITHLEYTSTDPTETSTLTFHTSADIGTSHTLTATGTCPA